MFFQRIRFDLSTLNTDRISLEQAACCLIVDSTSLGRR
jgi:hypothetical protein